MTAMRATEVPSTRERLLAAALEVFSTHGYDGARVQEIARRAGLTTGAIYGNFRGKAELLMEAIGSRSAEELDQLITPREQVQRDAADQMLAMGRKLMAGATSTRQALLIEALVSARRDTELASLIRTTIDDQRAKLRATVEHARAEGAIADAVDSDAFVSFGLALAFGSLLFKAIDLPRPEQGGWDELMTRFMGSLSEPGDDDVV
ncbi:MAG TPA: helix-turn-helix domain-containing protein [Acidimicrobiales bacterium]|nr:helix-turn-helix domain-containing protein [Acidimicrobiales bacterium]